MIRLKSASSTGMRITYTGYFILTLTLVTGSNLYAQQTPDPCPIPYTCQEHTEGKPAGTKPTEGYWRKAFKPDVLPVWIGGIAAILASIGGLVALYFIRKQTNVALLAANAALRSAEISMNAERAWIIETISDVTKPTQFDPVIISVIFTNLGRIPGRIKDPNIKLALVPIDDSFTYSSQLPPYDKDQVFLEIISGGLALAPQKSEQFETYLKTITFSPGEWSALQQTPCKLRLFLYGVVTYNDGFVDDRVNKFCYVWTPVTGLAGNGPAKFRRFGPGAYLAAT